MSTALSSALAGRAPTAQQTPGPRIPGADALRHQLDRLIPNRVPFAAVAGMAAILLALAYGMNHTSYTVWGGFWVAPVLLIMSLPVARRAARLDGEGIGRIVLLAATIKVFAAPLFRYWMTFSLYGGSADSALYHYEGVSLAPLFRHGIYQGLGQVSGTRFIGILTGQVYAFIGPTRLGGFMVFSWFAFIGCYLFYRAFRIAYPEGDGRRYAQLIFFFPTMMFWPSSIGKEAFMVLALGSAALGVASLVTGRLRGVVWLALGLWGAAVVRPHMALIAGAGLAIAAPVAVLQGGAQEGGLQRRRLGGAVLVLTMIIASSALISVAERFFGLQSLNTETAQEVLDTTTRRTEGGGSTFTGASPNSPVGFVLGGVTVLFRPFPGEVLNAQAMLTSLEGLALLVLIVSSRRRLRRLPRELLRRPYAAFAVVYTFAFIYAFSSVGNFGILARQRSQLLPALFVILCSPRLRPREQSGALDLANQGS